MITSHTAIPSRIRRTRFNRCQRVASRRARKSPYVCSTLAHLTAVLCVVTKFFRNPKKLVVLGNAIASTKRSRLDLSGVGSNRNVGNGGVFGFAGAMAD